MVLVLEAVNSVFSMGCIVLRQRRKNVYVYTLK